MTAQSAEVRAESRRRHRRAATRWRHIGWPLTVLAIGLLAGLALVALTTAMGGARMTGLVLILPAVLALVAVYGIALIILDALRGGLTAHEERDPS